MLVVMVRIPVGSAKDAERLEERFRNRAGLVDSQPGFLGFELLKGKDELISVTRWVSREDLDRWMQSQAHAEAHVGTSHPTGGGHPRSGAHPAATTDSRAGAPLTGSTMIYEVVIPLGTMDDRR